MRRSTLTALSAALLCAGSAMADPIDYTQILDRTKFGDLLQTDLTG